MRGDVLQTYGSCPDGQGFESSNSVRDDLEEGILGSQVLNSFQGHFDRRGF